MLRDFIIIETMKETPTGARKIDNRKKTERENMMRRITRGDEREAPKDDSDQMVVGVGNSLINDERKVFCLIIHELTSGCIYGDGC